MTGPPAPVAEVRTAVRRWLHAAVAADRLRPGDPPVTVACSGGADSLALAAATTFEAPRLGIGVAGVTVDHGLQAGSAERAEAVARQLTELGCDPVAVRRVQVGRNGGPEAAARTARYAALRSARPAGGWVLLGHTLDDQAETVLLGLGRGSGPRSLAGMRPVDRPWGRPLLGVRRHTTRAACAALGLPIWDDPHNADPRYTRVRLRSELLPLLDDVLAGGTAEALARSADLIRADVEALDEYAERALTELTEPTAELAETAEPNSIDAAALAALPTAVRRRVLRSWLADRGTGALTAAHLNAVDALVTDWRGQGPVDLPRGIRAVRRHGRLTTAVSGTVGRADPPRRAPDPLTTARPRSDQR